MFNRCRPKSASAFRHNIKVVNQACDVLFENEEGEIDNIFEDQMPFDTDADVIEIDDADYGIWYVTIWATTLNALRGKTVHFRGMVLKQGCQAISLFRVEAPMTCCADDTSFYRLCLQMRKAPISLIMVSLG